jgi:ABC-type multidrug transport system fused ATPase/permease subunit
MLIIFYAKVLNLIQLFYSNIEIIEAGISFEFVVLVATLLCVIGALIASFVINWNLSLILLCLLIFVVVVSFVLSQVFIWLLNQLIYRIVIDHR